MSFVFDQIHFAVPAPTRRATIGAVTRLCALIVLGIACIGCTDPRKVAYDSLSNEQLFKDPAVRALVVAAEQGDLEAIRRALDSGVDINARGRGGMTPLIKCYLSRSREGFQELLRLGADPDAMMINGWSVVHLAALNPDVQWLEESLAHGADPDLVDATNPRIGPVTPLHSAAYKRVPPAALVLIKAGANLEFKDRYDYTPLATALAVRDYEIAYYLFEAGAETDIKTLEATADAIEFVRRRNTQDFANSPAWEGDELEWFRKTVALLESRGYDMTPHDN